MQGEKKRENKNTKSIWKKGESVTVNGYETGFSTGSIFTTGL